MIHRGGEAGVPWLPMRALVVLSVALFAAGVAGSAWAIGQLREGAAELPQHWWSSAPLVVAGLGVLLAALTLSGLRRR